MNEVVEAGFAGVFYAEIIYDESERYTVSRMCEKTRNVGVLVVAVRGKVCDKVGVGDAPGNRVAIHSSVDLEEDSIVGYVLLEIEFQHCFLGDIFDCDRDEVGLIELAAEIKILDVDVDVASIGAMIASV